MKQKTIMATIVIPMLFLQIHFNYAFAQASDYNPNLQINFQHFYDLGENTTYFGNQIVSPDEIPEKAMSSENKNNLLNNFGYKASVALFNSVMDWINHFIGSPGVNPKMHHIDDYCSCCQRLISTLYPKGSIYFSTSSTNPSNFFKGTVWERWGNGRVPVGVDESVDVFSAPEKNGGERSVQIGVGNLPESAVTSHQYGEMEAGAAYTGLNEVWGMGDAIHTGRARGDAINNLQPYVTCYMWKRVG